MKLKRTISHICWYVIMFADVAMDMCLKVRFMTSRCKICSFNDSICAAYLTPCPGGTGGAGEPGEAG